MHVQYINLGELNHDPSTVNCTRYAQLWTSDGVLHSPGIPDAKGYDDITAACKQSSSQVYLLVVVN